MRFRRPFGGRKIVVSLAERQPHPRKQIHDCAAAPEDKKDDAFFTRIRAEQVNGKAETDKQQCHTPNQFFVFETVERISFGHHHIHLPQRGHTHADDAHRYKQDTDYFFIHN